jgi:hypothetical protein
MRVIYLDPGLRDERGHWANTCRSIRGELDRRGIPVMVLAQADIIPALRDELKAVPLFRAWTSIRSDGDPVSGQLNWFDSASRLTIEDLGRMRGVKADDICYLASAEPAQFMALVRWSQLLPEDQRPHIVMEFGADPGVDVSPGPQPDQMVLRLRDYRQDPRPMFYRFAARQMRDVDPPRFHMVTFDKVTSDIYGQVVGKPVGVLPLPQFAGIKARSRAGRRPVTVSVIGHQRFDKGYHLMPEIARLLLAHEPDVRLLIHNCIPEQMPQVQAELRAHAAVESRVTINEEVAGPALWARLVDQTDLMLCPYQPARYLASYSAVAVEALAHAIPLVVPAATSLSRMLADFGQPGTTFTGFDAAGVVAATREALAGFDALAERATAAASRWGASMGAPHTVQALLALCGRG